MTLPIGSKGLLNSEKRGRSRTRISQQARSTSVRIEAPDMPSFKATVNSVLRDLTVVGSVAKAADRQQRKT
jgi:tRNA threonylcarbamoyladenosine modification (KEOPS) complex  Pcc1 subunit